MEKVFRLNLVNSITGVKPANLIATHSKSSGSNVAIFSSVVHLGSNPPLIGFVMRPAGDVARHTLNNIEETGFYTINHVNSSFVESAHFTSASFDLGVSEFSACGLKELWVDSFPAPFVEQSRVRIGMAHKDSIPVSLNDTQLVIGEVQTIQLPDEVVDANGQCDLSKSGSMGISGLNRYYDLSFSEEHPYARVHELPESLRNNA